MAVESRRGAGLFQKLRRRRVFRVAALYIVGAWVIVQVADVAFPAFGIPDTALRYVFIAAFLGFPLALVFGWMFDLTAAGIVRTPAAADDGEIDADYSLKSPDYFILAGLVLVLGAIAWGTWVKVVESPPTDAIVESGADVHERSIAVLPFTNMSDNAGNDFLSDGIAEELLIRLTRIGEIRVSARTSSFAFRNREVDIPTIAKSLRVKHILEGSVRSSGQQIRITTNLIDAQTGLSLWSETYDRELDNIFAIQDDISAAVVEALKTNLLDSPITATPTDDLQAYQLYLEGRYELHRRNANAIRKSIDLFQQAIDRDPKFARAYAGLATAINVLPSFVPGNQAEAGAKARSIANQALELDPTLGDAEALLALISLQQSEWPEAHAGFDRALLLAPHDSNVRVWKNILLAASGQTRKALAEALLAHELDPLSGLIAGWLCALYVDLDQLETADRYCKTALEHGFQYANFIKAKIFLSGNHYEQAAESLKDFSRAFGRENIEWADDFITAMQDSSQQEHGIDAITSIEEHLGARWDIVELYVMLGDLDRAFATADLAIEDQSHSTLNAIWEPRMQNFRRDPRFTGLMQRLNLIAYWNEYGWPDLCKPADELLMCN